MPTSRVGMAGASPRAWCVIAGAWTTVVTAVTRLPGHQLTAQVSDGCGLGPAEQLEWRLVLTPLPWGRASEGRLEAGVQQEGAS